MDKLGLPPRNMKAGESLAYAPGRTQAAAGRSVTEGPISKMTQGRCRIILIRGLEASTQPLSRYDGSYMLELDKRQDPLLCSTYWVSESDEPVLCCVLMMAEGDPGYTPVA